jgi:hypothetical protein
MTRALTVASALVPAMRSPMAIYNPPTRTILPAAMLKSLMETPAGSFHEVSTADNEDHQDRLHAA